MILGQITDTVQTVVNEVVNTGIAVHEYTGGGQIINGIDNSIIGSLVSIIVAAIVRHFERKKLKKKLQQND